MQGLIVSGSCQNYQNGAVIKELTDSAREEPLEIQYRLNSSLILPGKKYRSCWICTFQFWRWEVSVWTLLIYVCREGVQCIPSVT
jgi:hypothetical protein